jgi:hypothetical protein
VTTTTSRLRETRAFGAMAADRSQDVIVMGRIVPCCDVGGVVEVCVSDLANGKSISPAPPFPP